MISRDGKEEMWKERKSSPQKKKMMIMCFRFCITLLSFWNSSPLQCNRKKEGVETDPLELGEGDEDDYREGEHEDDDGEDLFRNDEEFEG